MSRHNTPIPTFHDQTGLTDGEVSIPTPHLQTEYTYIADDALQHIVPQVEANIIEALPQAIHYDIFAGVNVNNFILDPTQFIYDQTKLGHPELDAEDAALFPPDLLEEMMKDRKNKAAIPPVDDIAAAKLRLLSFTNNFGADQPQQDESGAEKKKLGEKLEVVKPYQFATQHRKIAIMQSAEKNALNFYYNVCYTEDTIQTMKEKVNYHKALAHQKEELESDMVLAKRAELKGDKYATDVVYNVNMQDPADVKKYIEDSFAAMDEPPVHPTLGAAMGVESAYPFFPQNLQKFTTAAFPPHMDQEFAEHPETRESILADNRLAVISATPDTQFQNDYLLHHTIEFHSNAGRDYDDNNNNNNNNNNNDTTSSSTTKMRSGVPIWSFYHRKTLADMSFEPENQVLDDSSNDLLKQPLERVLRHKKVVVKQENLMSDENNNNNNNDDDDNNNNNTTAGDMYTYIWERLVNPTPPQQTPYEETFLLRLDPQSQQYYCTRYQERVRFKPWVRDRKVLKLVQDLPRVVTVNHPDYIQEAIHGDNSGGFNNQHEGDDDDDDDEHNNEDNDENNNNNNKKKNSDNKNNNEGNNNNENRSIFADEEEDEEDMASRAEVRKSEKQDKADKAEKKSKKEKKEKKSKKSKYSDNE